MEHVQIVIVINSRSPCVEMGFYGIFVISFMTSHSITLNDTYPILLLYDQYLRIRHLAELIYIK